MPEPKQLRALLAVSDEKASSALRAYFRAAGAVVEEYSPGAPELLAACEAAPDIAAIELERDAAPLARLRAALGPAPVVAVVPSPDLAFQAARLGAAELISLPLQPDQVSRRMEPLLMDLLRRAHPEPHAVEPQAAARTGVNRYQEMLDDFPDLFQSSPRMAEIRDTIDKAAPTSATVLIRGESGVGKELVARMIYARSRRALRPFIKVNCAAIPNDLLESELFGYEAGAFTGANRAKPGKFELAHTGTLFLDEIAEMHPALQAKLLHVLQDGEFSRLGAKRDVSVDVRLICATNKVLEHRVAEGLFREDLFYRINVVTVQMPPLRERREEIPVLTAYFLNKYASVYGRKVAPFSPEVMDFLLRYSWPGNIRELENLCKRYVIVGGATRIVSELALRENGHPAEAGAVEHSLPAADPGEAPSLLEIGRRAARQAEQQAIQDMLAETRWNRREAARRLKVSYKALLNKIQQMKSPR